MALKFAHTRTDTIPPEQLEESLQKELEDLHYETIESSNDANTLTRSITRMSRILAILSRQADVTADKNLKASNAVISLTRKLWYLTIVLALVAGGQVYLAFQQLQEAKIANALAHDKRAAEETKH